MDRGLANPTLLAKFSAVADEILGVQAIEDAAAARETAPSKCL